MHEDSTMPSRDADIGFTGWVSAEVDGGDVARLNTVLDQMKTALLG